MKVATIYGPVQEDLQLVEDTLDGIKHVESFPALSKMLSLEQVQEILNVKAPLVY